jgi:hypothetical protein
MQNVSIVSRPKFHALSNGDIVCAVSLILCTGKWIKLFTEAALPSNLHFQHSGTQLTGKPNASFKIALDFSLETALLFFIYFVFLPYFYL